MIDSKLMNCQLACENQEKCSLLPKLLQNTGQMTSIHQAAFIYKYKLNDSYV